MSFLIFGFSKLLSFHKISLLRGLICHKNGPHADGNCWADNAAGTDQVVETEKDEKQRPQADETIPDAATQ